MTNSIEHLKQACLKHLNTFIMYKVSGRKLYSENAREIRYGDGGELVFYKNEFGLYGRYTEYGVSENESGDIIDLACQYYGLPDVKGRNFCKLLECLGAENPNNLTKQQRKELNEKTAKRQQEAKQHEAKNKARNAVIVSSLSKMVLPIQESDAAYKYLAGRGIVEAVPFAGHIESGWSGGNEIAYAYQDITGQIVGYKRVFLNADGTKRKASIGGQNTKLNKVNNGATGSGFVLFPALGGPKEWLNIAEGEESAATIWKLTGSATVAVGGVGNFKAVIESLAGENAPEWAKNKNIRLFPDNDEKGKPAYNAFRKAAALLPDALIVEAKGAKSKGDFNDLLTEYGNDHCASLIDKAEAQPKATTEQEKKQRRIANYVQYGERKGFQSKGLKHYSPLSAIKRLEPIEAQKELEAIIKEAIEYCIKWDKNSDELPPIFVIKGTAGLGKTTLIAKCITIVFDEICKRGSVNYFAPTGRLCIEIIDKIKSQLQQGVFERNEIAIEGRNKGNCKRFELANQIAKNGGLISTSLCKSDCGECPFYQNCNSNGYLSQFKDIASIRALSHEYLFKPPKEITNAAFSVIDESVKYTVSTALTLDEITGDRQESSQATQKDRDNISKANTIYAHIFEAVKQGQSISETLDALGITKEKAQEIKQSEANFLIRHAGYPSATDGEIQAAIDKVDQEKNTLAGRRVKLWSMILENWGSGKPQSNIVFKERRGLEMNYIRKPKINTPKIIIDASADIELLKAVYGDHIRVVEIDCKLNQEVTQVFGRFSKRAFFPTFKDGITEETKGSLMKKAYSLMNYCAETLIDKAVKIKEPLLVITYKKLVELLKPLCEARGVQIYFEHFGNSRGVDKYKHVNYSVIIGDHTPPTNAMESVARAIYPYKEIETGQNIKAILPFRIAPDANLESYGIETYQSPSEDVQRQIDQVREQETIQAVARLRSVWGDTTKKIEIWSDNPIKDIEIFDLVSWQDRKVTTSPTISYTQAKRLNEAVDEAREGGLYGLRLSAKGLAQDAPQTFKNESQAKDFLKGLGSNAANDVGGDFHVYRNILITRKTPLTSKVSPARVKLVGKGNKFVSAFIFDDRFAVASGAIPESYSPTARLNLGEWGEIDAITFERQKLAA